MPGARLGQNALWNVAGMCAMAKHLCFSACQRQAAGGRAGKQAHSPPLNKVNAPVLIQHFSLGDFMGDCVHMHAPHADPHQRTCFQQQQQQLISLWIQSTCFLWSDWSLLIAEWINAAPLPPPPNCLPDHRGGFVSGCAQKSEVFGLHMLVPKQRQRLSSAFHR